MHERGRLLGTLLILAAGGCEDADEGTLRAAGGRIALGQTAIVSLGVGTKRPNSKRIGARVAQ